MTVRYDVAAEDADMFLRLMGEVEQSRYRTGARKWRLLQRSGAPEEYIEVFRVGSWREYRDQLQSRNTRFDADLLQRARALSAHPPIVEHLRPIEVRPPHGRRRER
ncbi:MFS transporter [Microbacterium aurum]|uniref:MFS transporter n=2 Tax=Microbacterium TaxID=33882 RepID=UPI001EF73450|nr:MFS transporter [Microbacterium aurum]